MLDTASAFLSLARERFGALTAAETAMLDAAMSGTVADCRGEERGFDPASADRRGDQRAVRAALLRWLLVDSESKRHVDPRGVQVAFADIEGELDLSFIEVDIPLRLLGCELPELMYLRDARLRSLSLTGSHVKQIMADGLCVAGDVFLNHGFQAKSSIRFIGASIDGTLDCRGGIFHHPDEYSLLGDRLQVGGDVLLNHGFQCIGAVRLAGAVIRGNLECDQGRFQSLVLPDAFIGKNFGCQGSTFKDLDGKAISGDRLRVGGDVFLDQGFHATGKVWLPWMSIAGTLDCSDSSFDMLLLENVTISGNVQLRRTCIYRGIYGRHANIKGTLVWHEVRLGVDARIVLSHSRAYQLLDGGYHNGWERYWPKKGNLDIDGLIYETLPENSGNHGSNGRWVQARLNWIGLQAHYTPQPYEQLIAVLRRMGHEAEAKTVAIAKQEVLRKSGTLDWWSSKRNWFLGFTIGHGYRPWSPLGFGAATIIVGWLLFAYGFSHGLLAANPDHRSFMNSSQHPYVLGFMYSLDVFLPIIDFGLGSAWYPIHTNGLGWVLLICYWLEIGFGWAISTLFVLAFTNLIRKD